MVVLTGFSDKKMSGLLFGPQKSGRNNVNGVVVWRGSTVIQIRLFAKYYENLRGGQVDKRVKSEGHEFEPR